MLFTPGIPATSPATHREISFSIGVDLVIRHDCLDDIFEVATGEEFGYEIDGIHAAFGVFALMANIIEI